MIWWGMVNHFPSMVHVRWTFKFLLFDSLNSLNSRNWRLCSTHWAPSLNWSSHSGETWHLFTSHQRWLISHHWAAPFFSKKRKENTFLFVRFKNESILLWKSCQSLAQIILSNIRGGSSSILWVREGVWIIPKGQVRQVDRSYKK